MPSLEALEGRSLPSQVAFGVRGGWRATAFRETVSLSERHHPTGSLCVMCNDRCEHPGRWADGASQNRRRGNYSQFVRWRKERGHEDHNPCLDHAPGNDDTIRHLWERCVSRRGRTRREDRGATGSTHARSVPIVYVSKEQFVSG
jgi:hypothetical protein